MKVYYRISDRSYVKAKLPGATKFVCLQNFLKVFEAKNTLVIADNCTDGTLKMLEVFGVSFITTALGNAGALRKALELATQEDDNTLVYFAEDDYLHLPIAATLLEEIKNRSDYYTLYDHPDKYTNFYDGGEVSQVIRTQSSHWRFTISTCMTFGCKVKTLKQDMDVWLKFTEGGHPHDHYIFSDLRERGRRLALCIPGVACHTDLTMTSQLGAIMVDDWAINLMIAKLEGSIEEVLKRPDHLSQLSSFQKLHETKFKTPWQRLSALDAFLCGLA